MPNPPNPFAAIAAGQKDGGASGRGRASNSSRAAPYQSRNTKESKSKARGRLRSASGRSGSSSSDAHGAQKKKQERPSDAPASTSPFAQLKSNGVTSQFGKPSLFPGAAQGSQAFGVPSLPQFGDSVDRNRDPRRRPAPQRPAPSKAAMSHVPVEDAKTINAYHERYEKLKLDRAKQRERAIRQGQMADPNQPTSLNKAITPVGTCTSMCPEFERVERIVQKMVDKSEKYLHPATNAYQNMESKMLKRFRRSAAGYDEQLPSDIRTPKTLLQTMNYLIRHVIGGPEPLGLIHKFVWDRTRSIRNDFSVQQLTQEDHVRMAVTCLERIARFHIVSLHLLSSPANQEQFDHHQEREQLNNTMLSLMYYYDDNRGRITFPNEEEFRAYYIVFAIHDQRPDLESRMQKWPKELLQSPKVRVALELLAAASNTWEYQGTLDEKRPNAIAQGFYTRFFSLVDSPSVSYLMACVAEIYFNNVRQTAIRSIWKAYCRYPLSQQHKNEEWTLAELTKALYFDNEDQARQFCEEQGLDFAENSEGQLYLDWGSRPIDSVDFQPSSKHAFSEKYVESKRGGRTLEAVILGLNIKQAARHGMIDRSLLATRTVPSQAASVSEASEEDELFVGEKESEVSEPETRVNGHSPRQVESDSAESVSSVHDSDGLAAQPAAQTAESKPTFSSLFGGFGGKPSNPFALQSQPSQPSQKQELFPSTAPKQETPSIFSQTPTPSSTPDVPSPKPATSSLFQPSQTSPFAATTAKPFSLAGGTALDTSQAAEKSANAFDSVKTNNIFGTTPSFSFTPNQSQSASTSFGSGLFSTPAQNGESKVGKTPVTFGQKNGVSPPSTEERPAIFPKAKPATPPVTTPPSFVSSPIATPKTAATATPPLLSTSQQGVPTTVQDSNPPVEQGTPKAAPTTETVPSVESDISASPETEEFRKSWVEALRKSVGGRRQDSPPSRKRRLEEEEESPSPEEESPKEENVSKPEKARPKRKSLALASIAPLPTLPILEEVKKMTTKRKPPPKEETKTRAQTQIDEDELLLSAARIAAESLKNGPKLFENVSEYAYAEPPRTSQRSPWSARKKPLPGG